MGKCGIPGPVGCWAKELGERVAERVAELASVVITPLGGLSAHLLVMPKRSQPHRKQKVWSGTVRADGARIRAGLPGLDIHRGPAAGTPDKTVKGHPRNEAAIRLENPNLLLDLEQGVVSGTARLSLDDFQYPRGLVDPTVFNVYIKSEPPKLSLDSSPVAFTGLATYGPVHVDFGLKLSYSAALGNVATRKGLSEMIERAMRKGFDLSGVVQLAIIKKIPFLQKLLRTTFSVTASPTATLSQPLLGAPVAFPMRYRASGIVPVPPGAIFDTLSLGYGLIGGHWGQSRGSSYAIAGLAVPSPTNLTEVSLYLYMDYYRVWRVGKGWDVAVRLTFSPEKTVGGKEQGEKPIQQQWLEASSKAWLEPSRENPKVEQAKPMFLGMASLRYRF